MKDYIVYFTKGFDEHTIERQKQVFPNAYISCIDSKPDYNKLLTESKLAKMNGFENFYILWERSDITSMSYEMKKEFRNIFRETAALPYKYVKSLREGDTGQAPAGQPPLGNPPPPPPPPLGTGSGTAPEPNNTSGGTSGSNNGQGVGGQRTSSDGDSLESAWSSSLDPNIGSSSAAAVRYTKNHTATIYIWPFNLFSANISSTGNGLQNLIVEMRLDNLSRIPNASVSSNATSTKKGDWQRILYIPQGQKELNQTLARADDMWNFTNKALLNTPFLMGSKASEVSKNFKSFINDSLKIAGTKTAFGPLTERGLIDACLNNGASLAKKGNIHVFYPAEYGKYLEWLPAENKSIINSIKNIPNIKYNATCIKSLEQMENYITSCAAGRGEFSVDDFKEILTSTSSEDSAKQAKMRLSELISGLNLNYYDIFWEYFNLYKLHQDVLGVPTGKGTGSDATNTEGVWSTLLGAIDDFLDNKHKNDLDWLKHMMGILPKGEATTGLKDKYDKAKEKVDQLGAIGSSAVNVVNSLRSKAAAKKAKRNNAKNANDHTDLSDDKISVNAGLGEEGVSTSLEGLTQEEIENLRRNPQDSSNNTEEENRNDSDQESENESSSERNNSEGNNNSGGNNNSEGANRNNEQASADPNSPSNAPGAVLNDKTLFKVFAAFSPEWESYVIPYFFTTKVYNSFDKGLTAKRVVFLKEIIKNNRANRDVNVSSAEENPQPNPNPPRNTNG